MTDITAEADIRERIAEADSLPTPPVVLTQISKVLSNKNASAYDIAAVVSEDPGMSAKILRMVNSAFYGLVQPLASVRQAIVILGIEAVRSLVLCAGVFDSFAGKENRAYQEDFWRHSLATASAARVLATASRQGGLNTGNVRVGREEAFSAGLLHDIGKMILICYLIDERNQVTEHPDYGKLPDYVVERDALGYDHALIGSILAERWRLPETLIHAIRDHHSPETLKSGEPSLSQLVHVANYLGHATSRKAEDRSVLPDINWEIAAILNVTEDGLESATDAVREEYGRSEVFLAMVQG